MRPGESQARPGGAGRPWWPGVVEKPAILTSSVSGISNNENARARAARMGDGSLPMNRAKRAETTTHNITVGPPSFTDLPIDRRPLPLAHLRQRGGAVQTKRSRRPSHRFRSRRRCRGYCTTRTAVLSAHALPRVPGRPRCAGCYFIIASLARCHYIIICFVVAIIASSESSSSR